MKIAVTGAAGFLGKALVPRLAADHSVIATDLVAQPGDPLVEAADVLDSQAMQALCERADAVVHLACAAWEESLDAHLNETCIIETRVKGTYNLLQAASRTQTRRVVQISDLRIMDVWQR